MSKLMLGSVRHQLDDKYRMRIPARFKEGLGSSPFMLPGRPGCLYVFPEESYEKLLGGVQNDTPYDDFAKQNLATDLLGNACYLEEDGQGRVRMEKEMREIAGVGKEIVFVGKGGFVEIWPAETWDARFNMSKSENRARLLEALEKRGV